MSQLTPELNQMFISLRDHAPILDTSLLFEKIKSYAIQCQHITEMGVRDGCSIFAFMAGLPNKIVAYDIYRSKNIPNVAKIAQNAGIEFIFYEVNTLEAQIEPTDLLFLDTIHTYDQVFQELLLHAKNAGKYILIHDTEVTPDCIPGMYVPQNDGPGVRRAIAEFLQNNNIWRIKEDIKESYGLMILSRK